MDKELDSYNCKEVWYILKKLPLNIISKIPFEVRNNLSERAEKCDKELNEIDTTVALEKMNITDNAKKILTSLYVDYLCDEETKEKVLEYINFCNKKMN